MAKLEVPETRQVPVVEALPAHPDDLQRESLIAVLNALGDIRDSERRENVIWAVAMFYGVKLGEDRS